MKGIRILAVLGALALIASPAFAWEIDAEWQIGSMAFDENLTFRADDFGGAWYLTLDRNDNLFYTGWFCTVGDYDYVDLEGGIEFGLWLTEADGSELVATEEFWGSDPWELELKHVESEDLAGDIYGYDFHAELGWGGEIGEESLQWAALMGYGFRKSKVQWVIGLDEEIIHEEFDDDALSLDHYYDVHYIDFTVRLKTDITDDLAFQIEPSIGPVIASSRDGDLTGSIEGQGGLLLQVEGVAIWNVQDNVKVTAGAFYDLMSLEGGERNLFNDPNIEVSWDDHVMEAFGATLGVDFLF